MTLDETDLKNASNILKLLLESLDFIISNKYEDFSEEKWQNLYGEIGSFWMNVFIGTAEYLKQHPDIKKYIENKINE